MKKTGLLILFLALWISVPSLAGSLINLNCSCISQNKDWVLKIEKSKKVFLIYGTLADLIGGEDPLQFDFQILSLTPVSQSEKSEVLIHGQSLSYGDMNFSLSQNLSCNVEAKLKGDFSHQVIFKDLGHSLQLGCCSCQ